MLLQNHGNHSEQKQRLFLDFKVWGCSGSPNGGLRGFSGILGDPQETPQGVLGGPRVVLGSSGTHKVPPQGVLGGPLGVLSGSSVVLEGSSGVGLGEASRDPRWSLGHPRAVLGTLFSVPGGGGPPQPWQTIGFFTFLT